HTLVKPKYFMPVHGEFKHLRQHALLAEELGKEKSHIFIMETGQVLELNGKEAKINGRVKTGAVLVDGIGVGDVGNIVLRDRKLLSQDGILTVVVTIDKESNSVLAGPDIISRGFVYVKESEALMRQAREIIKDELDKCLDNKITEWIVIKANIKEALGDFLYKKTKRSPLILPIIMET
ncbi:MAG: ribonuclease J, partial [Clostridiales bacterium]|nr:ribonuclease J [Clostridiales bacterium]